MRLSLLVCIACLLVASGTAAAQPPAGTLAPPGASGVDQYVETVPSLKGPLRTRRGGGARRVPPPGAGADSLPAATRAGLAELGADGRAVERLQDETGQPVDPALRDEVLDAATGGTGVAGAAVSRGLADSSSSGVALPLLLLLIAAGGVATWVSRRRRAARG